MKTIIFTLIFAFATFFAHAQQDYKALLKTFYEHSQNGFNDIIGEQTDTESNLYPSKISADIGEVDIYKNSFITALNWSVSLVKSKKVQQAVQEFIKTTYADTKQYKTVTEDENSDPNHDPENAINAMTQVYQLKTNGERPSLIFQTITSKTDFSIMMYEKH